MLYDSRQRALIIDRCWLIYDLIVEKFQLAHEFHIQFPGLVEIALISGYLQVFVEISRRGYFLHIHEEYDFREHGLVLKGYSYNLLDKCKHSVLRADALPYHRVDYKGHKLSHFPHHLHDERGRICQFSGRVEDFLERSSAIMATESQD